MTLIMDCNFVDLAMFTTTTGSPLVAAGELNINGVGAAMYGQKVPAAGTRIVCAGGPIIIDSSPSSTSSLFVCNATVSVQLQQRTGNKIRANCGATNSVDSAALTVGIPYWIDLLVRTDSTTYSIAWAIDGVAQAGATVTSTALDIANIRMGNTGTLAQALRFITGWRVTDQLADYPMGPWPKVPILNSGYYA